MASQYVNDPMLEVFIFETSQQLEHVEQSVLETETLETYPTDTINEIFRIMHTIKSSAAMMLFNNISVLAHTTEDLFYFIREDKPQELDMTTLSDLVLESIDFMKMELEKIENGEKADGDPQNLIENIKEHLTALKKLNNLPVTAKVNDEPVKEQYYISSNRSAKATQTKTYKAVLKFEEDCGMENIRAFTVIHNLKDMTEEVISNPEDVINDVDCVEIIRKDGLVLYIKTAESEEKLHSLFKTMAFIERVDLQAYAEIAEQKSTENKILLTGDEIIIPEMKEQTTAKNTVPAGGHQSQGMISVSVEKLDKLMNMVGEIVISEAMVIHNPDLNGLALNNFKKSALQLKKITDEL